MLVILQPHITAQVIYYHYWQMGSDIHTFNDKPKHNPHSKNVKDNYARKLVYQKASVPRKTEP